MNITTLADHYSQYKQIPNVLLHIYIYTYVCTTSRTYGVRTVASFARGFFAWSLAPLGLENDFLLVFVKILSVSICFRISGVQQFMFILPLMGASASKMFKLSAVTTLICCRENLEFRVFIKVRSSLTVA